MAGLQETKWFGGDSFSVGDATVLASGRPVPAENFRRSEGVALVLRRRAKQAFECGGCQWKAISSCIVTARLNFGNDNFPSWMTVMSCYAPTFRSAQIDKDEFLAQLEAALDAINLLDDVIVLGDFNARVVSGPQQMEMWQGVHGSHGVGEVNEAGHSLLAFLACQQLTVCNTLFPKKRIHMYTWQHPGSQRWHCIDYVIVRQRYRKRCMDCQVMRTAECSTDHRLIRMKYRLPDIAQQRYHRDSHPGLGDLLFIGLTGCHL
ncbi:craniofacial development protein 2-like [Sycon ciliatum]|uniref:craniofacial development protein 2-like n=1 Tax=Sycon ciliatum TaxID=27933 RepID=UPI0031F67261